MEEQQKSKMTLFTKISIIVNTLLFGITSIIYLVEGRKIVGYVLLAAGVLNVLSIFFTLHMKNYFFAVLYFLFAAASLIVCLDFLSKSNVEIGMIWLVITLIYLIVGFILFYKLKKTAKKV